MRDLHYDEGTTIEMTCRVERPPLYHVTLDWVVEYQQIYASSAAGTHYELSETNAFHGRRNRSIVLNRV